MICNIFVCMVCFVFVCMFYFIIFIDTSTFRTFTTLEAVVVQGHKRTIENAMVTDSICARGYEIFNLFI